MSTSSLSADLVNIGPNININKLIDDYNRSANASKRIPQQTIDHLSNIVRHYLESRIGINDIVLNTSTSSGTTADVVQGVDVLRKRCMFFEVKYIEMVFSLLNIISKANNALVTIADSANKQTNEEIEKLKQDISEILNQSSSESDPQVVLKIEEVLNNRGNVLAGGFNEHINEAKDAIRNTMMAEFENNLSNLKKKGGNTIKKTC